MQAMLCSLGLTCCLLNVAQAEFAERWHETLNDAAFVKDGLERLYNPHYQYAILGLGGTTMRVSPYGFTRQQAPRIMPGGFLQHRPYLAYQYWWDEEGHRHQPFILSAGYGEKLEPGQVTAFREHLDINSGMLTLDLGLRTDPAWEGLYQIGKNAFTSTRDLFITPEGVLVVRVTDAKEAETPLRVRVDTEQWVRVYLNQGIYDTPHAPWTGQAVSKDDGMVVTATRPKSCNATLALALEGAKVDGGDAFLAVGERPGGVVTCYIAPGSSYADADPAAAAWARAEAARAKGFEALRAETAQWWQAFNRRSMIQIPDPALARWYARSIYYHGVFFGNTDVPPGCNGTSIESFAGAVCPEYDLAFSQFALLATNHFDESARVAGWVARALPRAKRYATEGLNSHEVKLKYTGGAKYGTLMGYDGAITLPPTPGEGVNAYENFPGINAAAMALAHADWSADGKTDDTARQVLKATTQVAVEDQQWRDDFQGYLDRHMGNSVQQTAVLFGLRESIRRGVAEPEWRVMAEKVILPEADYLGRTVIPTGPGAQPFPGYGDAPWLVGLWWLNILEPGDPRARPTYDMIRESLTWKYVFNGGWMGVYAAKLGLGEDALHWARNMIQPAVTLFDDTCFGELVYGPEDFKKTPEIGAHGALICNVTHMLLEADGSEDVTVFPAIPEAWVKEGVAFRDLAANGGLRVSASIGRQGTHVTIRNAGRVDQARNIRVRTPGGWESLEAVTLAPGAQETWRF